MVLLDTGATASRIHASRRVFEILKRESITVPVIHHIRFAQGTVRWGGDQGRRVWEGEKGV